MRRFVTEQITGTIAAKVYHKFFKHDGRVFRSKRNGVLTLSETPQRHLTLNNTTRDGGIIYRINIVRMFVETRIEVY